MRPGSTRGPSGLKATVTPYCPVSTRATLLSVDSNAKLRVSRIACMAFICVSWAVCGGHLASGGRRNVMANDAANQRRVLGTELRIDRRASGTFGVAGAQHQLGPVEQAPRGECARQVFASERRAAVGGDRGEGGGERAW